MKLPNDPERNLNQYAKYSGMALQMMVIIVAGAFGGLKLDEWLKTKPVLTVILSIASVFLAMYYVTRDLLKKK
ncbi:MAG: AtpZ/AtpI family protein [Bacteroidetes bacterium]|nr:AtpZ/AtpI family protein [Bacteroidota bacterium]